MSRVAGASARASYRLNLAKKPIAPGAAITLTLKAAAGKTGQAGRLLKDRL